MIPKREQKHDDVDSWLMSYADMVTLLLAFFVIFVSTSVPKQDQLAAATMGMKKPFGALTLETPFDGVYQNLQGIVAGNKLEQNVLVQKTSRGLRMEVASGQFFVPGSAQLSDGAEDTLKQIAETVKSDALHNYAISVEAYTSNAAIPGTEFASHWELSAAQAARVVRVLMENGVPPDQLTATGFGNTRPSVPNNDAQGNAITANQDKNNRVLIKMEKAR